MTRKDSPIGVFDSGIGGLTVLHQIIETLPHENTIYLGDTARAPYGTKSMETVLRYSFENSEFLIEKDVKLVVVACNTSTAIALGELRDQLTVPVIGVIEPGVRARYETYEEQKGRSDRHGSDDSKRRIYTRSRRPQVLRSRCTAGLVLSSCRWSKRDGPITKSWK